MAPARVLDRGRAALVVVDVQKAFRPAVRDFDEVAEHLGEVEPIAKVCFSAAAAEGFDLDGRDPEDFKRVQELVR